jgi:hypothetical protein
MTQSNDNTRLSKAAQWKPKEGEQEGSRPSKVTMAEVRKLFSRYSNEVNANVELAQTSKTMYIDFAGCFVRWMAGSFNPGSVGSVRRRKTTRIWLGRPLE